MSVASTQVVPTLTVAHWQWSHGRRPSLLYAPATRFPSHMGLLAQSVQVPSLSSFEAPTTNFEFATRNVARDLAEDSDVQTTLRHRPYGSCNHAPGMPFNLVTITGPEVRPSKSREPIHDMWPSRQPACDKLRARCSSRASLQSTMTSYTHTQYLRGKHPGVSRRGRNTSTMHPV